MLYCKIFTIIFFNSIVIYRLTNKGVIMKKQLIIIRDKKVDLDSIKALELLGYRVVIMLTK
jgi:hypothetical protein